MKQFENKATELKNAENIDGEIKTTLLDYVGLAKTCLNFTEGRGLDLKALQARHRVFQVFDVEKDPNNPAKEIYNLEDADYQTLKQCVEAMKWQMYQREIAEFVQYVLDIQKQENPKPKLKEVK